MTEAEITLMYLMARERNEPLKVTRAQFQEMLRLFGRPDPLDLLRDPLHLGQIGNLTGWPVIVEDETTP